MIEVGCNSCFTVPLAQVKSLYTALDNNKENRKPSSKDSNLKENQSKKQQKKQPEKKKEVKEKPSIPKSLEMAVKMVCEVIFKFLLHPPSAVRQSPWLVSISCSVLLASHAL